MDLRFRFREPDVNWRVFDHPLACGISDAVSHKIFKNFQGTLGHAHDRGCQGVSKHSLQGNPEVKRPMNGTAWGLSLPEVNHGDDAVFRNEDLADHNVLTTGAP